MSKYQAYPEYKDSNIEWLDKIPANWKCVKTSYFFKIGMGQTILKEQLIDNGLCPVYSATEKDIFLGRINNPNVKLIAGDIVIPARGNSIGAVKLVSQNSTTTQTTIYCKPLQPHLLVSKFVYYFFNGERKNLFWFTQTAIPQITTEEVGSNPLLLPSISEQTQIAAFLDHETAKIDTLIEKQQQLIELLKEKRQAVISHAVTKGLNPDAPMKDSGVEWLGEVPDHWQSASLRRIIKLMEQGKSPECLNVPANENQWGVLKTSCVNGGIFSPIENKALPAHLSPHTQYQVQAGDIVMSRASGSINLIGSVALVQDDIQTNLLLSDKIFRLFLTSNMDSQYFVYLMNSQYVRKLVEMSISGAEGMANNITKSAIMAFPVVIAPLKEQQEIANYLKSKLSYFDELVHKANTAINLMQERRTALISAAVTGKIDVRNWVVPTTSDTNEVAQEVTA